MNTIIVPTDFSSSSDNAMHYAAQLANSIPCRLYLLHVYQIPVSISDIPVMTISGEELKKSADEGLERCREELQKTFKNIDIQTESRLGDVVSELKDVCREIDPLMILLGSHHLSGFERILFGSTTFSVVRNLNCPVLAIASETKFHSIQNIVFATDLEDLNGKTAEKLSGFVQLFKADLHVVHVTANTEKNSQPKIDKIQQHLHSFQPVYHEVKDEDVAHGIKTYGQENGVDLLVVIQHRHTFWERFLFKTHAESMLMNVSTPVLFLPEENE